MSEEPRQRIERVGRRRVRLTPAPGAGPEPIPADDVPEPAPAAAPDSPAPSEGPNDDRMRRDVPPHW